MTIPAAAIERAVTDARNAAERSAVEIRELNDMRSLIAVQRLYETVWRTGPTGTPVTADLLRALAKSGNPVFGAYDGETLVGACFGFCSPPDTGNMHSHIAGVLERAQGRSIGLVLKLHQRAWALGRGMRTMTWTFDPLIRRNAVFNLVKLGVESVEYLADFYGDMDDAVNRNDASDRLLVRWQLDAPIPGGPDAPTPETHDSLARIEIPADIETMRLSDAAAAGAWRIRLRDELGGRMAEGGRVVGFDRDGHYLVAPTSTLSLTQETL